MLSQADLLAAAERGRQARDAAEMRARREIEKKLGFPLDRLSDIERALILIGIDAGISAGVLAGASLV